MPVYVRLRAFFVTELNKQYNSFIIYAEVNTTLMFPQTFIYQKWQQYGWNTYNYREQLWPTNADCNVTNSTETRRGNDEHSAWLDTFRMNLFITAYYH